MLFRVTITDCVDRDTLEDLSVELRKYGCNGLTFSDPCEDWEEDEDYEDHVDPVTGNSSEFVDYLVGQCDQHGFDYEVECKYSAHSAYWNDAARCADTGDWHDLSEMQEDMNTGELLCNDSWNERYFNCYHCGEDFSRDDECYDECNECTCCPDCHTEHSYGSVQEFEGLCKTFGPDNSFGSSRSFGVELETDGGRCSTNYAFDGKYDGSICGTEFVSHKLRGDAGIKEIRDFMASGEGIDISEADGFHLHINVSDLSENELYAVYAAYMVTEDWWHNQVCESRHENDYCYGIRGGGFPELKAHCFGPEAFYNYARCSDRYFWMNRTAYAKFKTFENRLHHGTWNANEVVNWVKLNLRFVRAARYLRIRQDDTFATFAERAKLALQWAASGSLERPYTAKRRRETAACA